MPKRIYLTPPVIKILIVVGVVIAAALYVYLTSGMPAPRESDRVSMADGSFSIIKPHGWGSSTGSEPEDSPFDSHIELWHPGMSGAEDFLVLSRIRIDPTAESLTGAGMTLGSFQGREAYFRTVEKPREYQWRMVFKNEGAWYNLLVRLRYKEDIPRSDWWGFISSFRSAPRPASQPATTQMNAPTTTSQS